jgi:Tfp pilus assembly protein PilX
MKIFRPILPRQRRQRGSAVVVYLVLLAIMVILAAANSNTLLFLRRELNLLDQRQIKRLNASAANSTGRAELPLGQDAPQRVPAKFSDLK